MDTNSAQEIPEISVVEPPTVPVVVPSPPPASPVASTCCSIPYYKRLLGRREKGPGLSDEYLDVFATWILASIAMVSVSILHAYIFVPLVGESFIVSVAPFGASCALLFGGPQLPASQPKSLFLGHFIGALCGLVLGHACISLGWKGSYVAGGLAVGLTCSVLNLLGIQHPPASAMAFAAADIPRQGLLGEGFLFLVFPAITGSFVLFMVAWLGNNMFPKRSPYPKYWW